MHSAEMHNFDTMPTQSFRDVEPKKNAPSKFYWTRHKHRSINWERKKKATLQQITEIQTKICWAQEGMQREILEGMGEGKIRKGRGKTKNQIVGNMKYENLIRMA